MPTYRPNKLIGVLGTHTEVGKTFVIAQWLTQLRKQGLAVAARKPVQSFDAKDETTDAAILAAATGEAITQVCPSHRCYPLALAPPMAADLLRKPRIALDDLLSEIVWPHDVDVGVVETVGGPRSPISHDGDSIDLIRRLQPDHVVLVADAGLGALNAVRLSLACIEIYAESFAVFLNRYDHSNELHRLNRQWLSERNGIDVRVDSERIFEDCFSVTT